MTHINNSISVISNEPPQMIYLTEGRYGGCIVCICIPMSFEFTMDKCKIRKGRKSKKSKKTKNLFVNFSSLCALFRLLSWIYGCHQKEGKFWQRIYVNKKCKQTSYTKLIDINNKPQEDRRFDSDATFVRQNVRYFCLIILRTSNNTMGLKC